jgi:hypothetical protein
MLDDLEAPSQVGFHLLGAGLAGSYYGDDDWYVTAHLRWVLLLLWKQDMHCWSEKLDGTSGPGVALTLGKEWYGDDDRGIGLAVQGNYARLTGSPELHYVSVLGMLSLTKF